MTRGDSDDSRSALPAYLRQRPKPADLHLQQLMLFGLIGERFPEERLEWNPGSERSPQIHLVIAEQACAKTAVGGQAHAIARRAVRVRHWRDDADRADSAGPLVIRCRPVAHRRAARR